MGKKLSRRQFFILADLAKATGNALPNFTWNRASAAALLKAGYVDKLPFSYGRGDIPPHSDDYYIVLNDKGRRALETIVFP